MRNRRVVFHVGAHKTGTSLLQKFMRDKREMLTQHGIYYLSRSSMNDYVGWGDQLLAHPRKLRVRIEATLAAPRYSLLIASHENTLGRPVKPGGRQLYPDSPPLIDALGHLLRSFDTRVVYYIRPQEEFLESYYLQRIHEGRSWTFEEWLGRYDLDAMSWAPVVGQLRSVFGPERVEIADFHTIKQGQEAFIRDFFHRIDPTLDIEVNYDPVRNPSISEKGLQMALAANPHLKKSQRKIMRKFLQKHFSNRTYPRPVLMTDEQKARLRDRYEEENRALLTDTPARSVRSQEAR